MPGLPYSCILLAAFTTAFAADGPRFPDSLSETATTTRKTQKDSSANIRVDVNMTLVPVTVMDQTGHSVLGLERGNFRVFDGADPRPIVSFGQQDAPIAVGLVFDCSRSMTEKFLVAREAPSELYRQLNPEDESFLVTVSSRAVLRQGLTSNFEDIRNALVFTAPDGTTSLLDGVYMGLAQLKRSHKPRKALVVVSDGGDNDSRYTLAELASIAAESDVQLFSICLYGDPQTREEADGPALLGKLAQVTGGISYMINDMQQMRPAMAKIGVNLHNEYVLGYYPPDDAPAGKYRKIKVQVLLPVGLPKLKIYSRAGYYVPQR
jgi:Ca-activated chloride channel family protein